MQVYWEGLGLKNSFSGIGVFGERVRHSLKEFQVYPELLGVHSNLKIVDNKLLHPLYSRLCLGMRPRGPAVVHGLANVNLIPFLSHDFRQVLSVHDIIPLLENSGLSLSSRLLLKVTSKLAFQAADKILVPSKFTKNCLLQVAEELESKIEVIPYGSAMGVPALKTEKKPIILMVSRWEPYKGFDALAEIIKKRPDWRFRVVTDALGVRWLKANVVANSLEVFKGVSKATIQSFYSEAKVVFHPSHYEGFGLPAVEGLTAGCPVVFRKGSSIEEFCPQFLDGSFESCDEAISVISRFLEGDFQQDIENWVTEGAPTWRSYAKRLSEVYQEAECW